MSGKGRRRMLNLVKPFLLLLPDAAAPKREVRAPTKVLNTAIALLGFLIFSQLPLYGIHSATGSDPLYSGMRVILASNRRTIMEFGITPIVTSGMVMQLLVGSKIIKFNYSVKEDQILLKGAQKLLAILITVGQAVVYVLSGMYGDLGAGNAALIIAQLVFAGIILICLDELLQNGYGIGSASSPASSLFIATNICENILWKAFSPLTINYGRGAEFEGAVVSLFGGLISRTDQMRVLREAFFRRNLPNLTSLLATVVVFLIFVYFHCFRVILSVRTTLDRGEGGGSFPIKLFYTSTMPIILVSALVSNLYFISQLLYKKFGGIFLVRLLGHWKEPAQTSFQSVPQLIPAGGLLYYITPPNGVGDILPWYRIFHAVFYVTFMLTACTIFSTTWLQVSGTSSRGVAKLLKEQSDVSLVVPGHRGVERHLDRYIPTAAALGGMCVGALTIVADFMLPSGGIASAAEIFIVVSTVFKCWDAFDKGVIQQFGILR